MLDEHVDVLALAAASPAATVFNIIRLETAMTSSGRSASDVSITGDASLRVIPKSDPSSPPR